MKIEHELIHRVKAPTPKFFRAVRRIGITLGAVGTALLTAPVALPATITTIAGYLVATGLVATAVSSAAVADGTDNGAADRPQAGAAANRKSAAEGITDEPMDPGASGKEDTP